VSKKQSFLNIDFTKRFKESYASYDRYDQVRIDHLVMAISKGAHTPGMRIKPLLPDKYHYEARVNDADRLIFRIENESLIVTDVVPHDLIRKYGSR
jgi:Txe/YoeB family toxin of Txe-Axe toxin-antitoxin module